MKNFICILLVMASAAGYPQTDPYKYSPMDCSWQNVGNRGFSAGSIIYTSIAVNPLSEQPYVAYVDRPSGTVFTGPATVMRFDGNDWVNVGAAGFTTFDVGFTSLTFTPAGEPCVAFGATCSTPNKATVLKFDGANWAPIGTGGFSQGEASYTSLAFSPAGEPWVAFLDMANSNKVTVMKFDGTNWLTVGTPGFSAGEAWWENIGFSPSGEPYVSYWNNSFGHRATVMKFNGTAWECVGGSFCTAGRAENPSLAVSPVDGQPYLAYTDTIHAYKATVIRFDGTNWVNVGTAGFSTGYASAIRLAFSPAGQLYIFYWDNYLTNSVVKKFDGTGWVDVGASGFTGGFVSFTGLAFSPSGTPYVTFQDYINSDKASVMKYDFPAGVYEQKGSDLMLYPNPATSVLNVDLTKIPGHAKEIKVLDVQGKTMWYSQASGDKFNIVIPDYPAGIYILKVNTETSHYTAKFCKSR
ncbi:MAG: T9SS type A sorting domain-containing protein [Bacteroidetes bacterium]|nr:T9SS type A sorting domain-containing protein [Bacteroidota bacterium]